MPRIFATAIAAVTLLATSSVSAKTDFPPNVTVAKDKTLERVDWSFTAAEGLDFARIKRCVATNVHNEDVQLRDSAGSWVGPATGTYYSQDNRTTAPGRSLFKYVDDAQQTLIANGQTDPTSGLSGWIIRYELEAALEKNRVVRVMRNIQLAASNTGSASNDGFRPLGTWFRFKSNYAALEADAIKVKSCILE